MNIKFPKIQKVHLTRFGTLFRNFTLEKYISKSKSLIRAHTKKADECVTKHIYK